MFDKEAGINKIESAIEDYIKNIGDESVFTTGWALVTALSSASLDASSDSYISLRSNGMPHHSFIGLLGVGIDMNGSSMEFDD